MKVNVSDLMLELISLNQQIADLPVETYRIDLLQQRNQVLNLLIAYKAYNGLSWDYLDRLISANQELQSLLEEYEESTYIDLESTDIQEPTSGRNVLQASRSASSPNREAGRSIRDRLRLVRERKKSG